MEDWNNRWKKLNNYIDDLRDMYYYPEEWNEAYDNGYVKLPWTEENYNLIQFELAEKQIDLLTEKQQLLFNKKQNTLSEYMFITINPKPDISVKTLYDKLMKLFKSVNILNYLMVLEQRGNDVSNIGKGLHTHFIIKNKYPKFCKLRKHLDGLFGDIVGNSRHIDIKNCKHSTDVSNRLKYMLGQKEGEDKQIKQYYDKIWRDEKGIEDYYGDKDIGYLRDT